MKVPKNILTATLTSLMITFSMSASVVNAKTETKNEGSSNEVAAKRLNDLLANIKGMSADFKQTTIGQKSKKNNLSAQKSFSGSMMVQRPNNLRWETKQPSEQLIIANDKKMWVYDKDLEQATKHNTKNQLGNTPALLLSGDYKKIVDKFIITQPNPKKHYYKLYPKAKDANFNNMTISFSQGKPIMMVLNDSLGQTTSIKFSKIKLNPSLNKKIFEFIPPEGIDVIRQ